MRPSAKTSIFAPARWGVDPLRADHRHERDRFAALERVGRRGQDFLVQTSTSILAFFFSESTKACRLLLLLLLGQELADARR